MKKSDFILIGVVVLAIFIGIFSSKGTVAEEEISFPLTLTGEVGLNEISYNRYKEMVANGDAFIVVIERTGCSYCQKYMPILEKIASDKKIAINYINTDNLSEVEYYELESTNRYLKKNKWGTPTTLFMLGDRIVDSIGGYTEEDTVLNFLDGRVVFGE